jgi:hypothetical protein
MDDGEWMVSRNSCTLYISVTLQLLHFPGDGGAVSFLCPANTVKGQGMVNDEETSEGVRQEDLENIR